MCGIVLVCGLGFASAVFPIIEQILSVIFIVAFLAAIIAGILYIRRERQLDYDAFYGPITESHTELEKEHSND